VTCSKGTYVRSLARDIAGKLNVCGYVSKLERLQVGFFIMKNTISLDKLKNIFKFSVSDDLLLRLRDVLHFITEIKLNSFDVEKIRNGQFIDYSCDFLQEYSVVKIIFDDILIALARFENNSLKPINVF
jgi:tRNA pseudouridine55 synthase